jgi:Glycosyl hydrolase family 1
VRHAVSDGHDVRGFMYWTLVDNFEWCSGFHEAFGIYAFRPELPYGWREARPSLEAMRRLFKACVLPPKIRAPLACRATPLHACQLQKACRSMGLEMGSMVDLSACLSFCL